MKSLATVVCCVALAAFGLVVGLHNPVATNTVSAEPNYFGIPAPHILKHDTVEVTTRDTIRVKQIVKQTKYRTKRVVDTVKVEVPILYTRTRGTRKEISPDSLLSPRNKRITKKVIELEESETRL